MKRDLAIAVTCWFAITLATIPLAEGLAEEGRGRTQIRGQAVRELRPGESIWSPPGATHWHGAAPDGSAKLYQISRGETTWLEEVRDQGRK